MPIADCYSLDYPGLIVNHVDGVLSYDTGTAGQAAVGDYVRGTTSGAIGKVIAVTGNAASGTYTLTVVEGLFQDNEAVALLSVLGFDAVTAGNGGFQVGDTIDDQVTGTMVVRAIEYNADGSGAGVAYGDTFTAFTDDSQLDISAPAARIQSDVADVNTAGGNTDNDAVIDTALVAGTLAVPGTADTNDSCVVNFDTGTVAIPEQAIIEGVTSGAVGLVEQVYGTVATGSVRLVDSDFGAAAFQNNETLRVQQVVNYDNQTAGQVFTVGDVIVGSVSGATGRVVGIVILTSTTGRLILADQSGTFNAATPDLLQKDGVTIAEVADTVFTLNVALVNGLARTEQRPTSVGGSVDQGGIYDRAESLNIVRKFNSLYTFSQDTFDELAQLDDDEALDAAFKGFAYSLVFGWAFAENTNVSATRFLRKGALIDSTGSEVWANPQTQGAQNKITSTAFLQDSTQTFKQPQLYIEQNGAKVPNWWLEGNLDVLLKVRTRKDPRFIAAATPTLGQLIPGGDPSNSGFYTVFNREFYTSTYDATEVDGSAGVVNSVALGTLDDTANNSQGTHTMAWDAGSAATLLVGEEIRTLPTSGNSAKVGVVVAQTGDAGATGTVEYVLKSGTQFADNEAVTAAVSGKTFNVEETGGFDSTNDVVAGFGTDIAFVVVDIGATPSGGTGITGTFIPGEGVTQAVTGATGRAVYANTTSDVLYIEVDAGSAAFSGDNDITGDVSSASWDAGTGASYPSALTFDADLNNGDGAQPYSGAVSGDIANTGAETIQNVYQYSKYLASAEQSTILIGGPGTAGGDDVATQGNLFRRLKDNYTEIKPGNPFGTYAAAMSFAQGWFLDTGYIAAADIRAFSVVDDNGVPRSPPNLQSLIISGVANGWRVAAYRSTGSGLTSILRNEFDVGTVGGGNNQDTDSTVLIGDGNGGGSRTVSPTPADIPDVGVLRVLSPNGTGNYIRMTYSSVNRTTNIFTLTGTIASFLTAAGETSTTDLVADDNVHVAPIEQEASAASVSNTIQYVADIPIVYKARLKGFKPFRSTGTFGNAGVTLGVVQTADTIVDLP